MDDILLTHIVKQIHVLEDRIGLLNKESESYDNDITVIKERVSTLNKDLLTFAKSMENNQVNYKKLVKDQDMLRDSVKHIIKEYNERQAAQGFFMRNWGLMVKVATGVSALVAAYLALQDVII